MQEVQTDVRLAAGSAAFPESSSALPPSSQTQLDQALARLHGSKTIWPTVDLIERIQFLEDVRLNLQANARLWVEAALRHKRIPWGGMGEGEEWAYVSIILRAVVRLQRILGQLRMWSRPRLPQAISLRPNGQIKVEIFPDIRLDKLFFSGMRGEVWLEPGVAPEAMFDIPPVGPTASGSTGALALVLGAGNLAPMAFLDVLSKLFTHNQVVLLKMNPANDYLGPLYEDALRSLIRAGFVQVVYGGAQVGAYLCHHPQVETIHLTGSDKTYEAIVFGPGPEGAARKANGTPLLDKPVTAELGGVNPMIVVPGPWSAAQLRSKADLLASHLYSNASFNCLTPRVFIQHKDWPQRESLIRATGELLSRAGSRPAYYPGAEERYHALLENRPRHAREKRLTFGEEGPGTLPFTLLYDLDPAESGDPLFRTETFCSLYAETALAARSVPEFIHRAVDFANQRLWGNLAASILIHPASLRDPETAAAFEQALTRLEYGIITVNTAPGIAYGGMIPPFGAFPGNTPGDVRSGIGKMNNFYFLCRPQKAVLRASFNALNTFSLSIPAMAGLSRQTLAYFSEPNLGNLLRVAAGFIRK